MARRINLREYQEGLMARLKMATTATHAHAHLGVRIGSGNWLLDLADVAEVMPVPTVSSVPLAQSWFRGVANVRGKLVGVSDIAAFFGGPPLTTTAATRLVLLHQRHILHGAILVERMLGLKHLAQMQLAPTATLPAWTQAQYQDAAGGRWQMLDVARLAHAPRFLQAGMH